MPTFDFQCSACNHVFEFTRPFGSKEHPACTSCGRKKTHKLITPPAIQFKGEGWYKTDSRKVPVEKKTEAPKPEQAKPAETKTAEKKDTKTSDKNMGGPALHGG